MTVHSQETVLRWMAELSDETPLELDEAELPLEIRLDRESPVGLIIDRRGIARGVVVTGPLPYDVGRGVEVQLRLGAWSARGATVVSWVRRPSGELGDELYQTGFTLLDEVSKAFGLLSTAKGLHEPVPIPVDATVAFELEVPFDAIETNPGPREPEWTDTFPQVPRRRSANQDTTPPPIRSLLKVA